MSMTNEYLWYNRTDVRIINKRCDFNPTFVDRFVVTVSQMFFLKKDPRKEYGV